jgi:TonB family protein
MTIVPARSMLVSLVAHGVVLLALVTLRSSPRPPEEVASPRRLTLLMPLPSRAAPRQRVKRPIAVHPFVLPAPRIPRPATEVAIEIPATPIPEAPRFDAPRPEFAQVFAPMKTDNFTEMSAAVALHDPTRPVVRSGFADTTVTALPKVTQLTPVLSKPTPVEIISKPRPAYTEEARSLRIEGEVLVEVLFGASGEARIVHVLRGLGHGLDESASAAAREIHFRPAKRDGVPVDSVAIVHIFFQLAY